MYHSKPNTLLFFWRKQPLDFLSKHRKVLKGGQDDATLFAW
jgi:hypothetical protein